MYMYYMYILRILYVCLYIVCKYIQKLYMYVLLAPLEQCFVSNSCTKTFTCGCAHVVIHT